MKVKLKRFTCNARVLTRATQGSACFFYVYSAENVTLEPGVTRSGLSLKPCFLGGGGGGGGAINSDYRGNVSVILTNFSS